MRLGFANARSWPAMTFSTSQRFEWLPVFSPEFARSTNSPPPYVEPPATYVPAASTATYAVNPMTGDIYSCTATAGQVSPCIGRQPEMDLAARGGWSNVPPIEITTSSGCGDGSDDPRFFGNRRTIAAVALGCASSSPSALLRPSTWTQPPLLAGKTSPNTIYEPVVVAGRRMKTARSTIT